MSYAVSTIIDELAGVLHGTTVNKITNLGGVMNRAARKLLLDCNPIETKRIGQLGQLFNSFYDYAAPTDLKGVEVIDIRPQAGRWPSDQYEQAFGRWFDANKALNWNNAFNVQHNTGVKSLRIETPSLLSPLTITDTGTVTPWAVHGTGSAAAIDTNFNVAGGGDITFNVATGTGGIQTSTLSAVDLTGYPNVGQLFFWLYLPVLPTSLTIAWGSDITANYYSYSPTTQADGTALRVGWNQIGFAWTSATVTGSPTVTAYDSVKLSIGAPSAMTGVKFCNFTTVIGTFFEMVYYSKYLFSTAAGTWKEIITDVNFTDLTTTINLDVESYNMYFSLLAYYVSQQLQGADASKDGQFFLKEYNDQLKRYTAMYKSEVTLPSEPYYVLRRNNQGLSTAPRWGA